MTPPVSARRRRSLPLVIAIFSLLVYLAVDGLALSAHQTMPQWQIRVDSRGAITWVDPNGPAADASLHMGDHLVRAREDARVPYTVLAQHRVLVVRRQGARSALGLQAPPLFGPTLTGQMLVLVGLLFLLVGNVVWVFGRGGTAPTLLSVFSASAALTLLGNVWEHDGQGWAMRLTFVTGPVLFPIMWAAFFLSFPRERLAMRRWRLSLTILSILAVVTLVAYTLCLLAGLPYAVVHAVSAPIFPLGLLIGLFALFLRGHDENIQLRQQRRIVSFSAAGAMLPVL